MILISGEALVDLIPDPEKPDAYDAVLGGSPYNVAIGLARLGAPVGVRLAHLGRTPTAKRSRRRSRPTASTSRFVARDPRPTTLAFVMRGTAQTGSRYSFYLDGTAYDGPWPFPEVWPRGAASARRLDLRRRPAARRARRRRA